MLLLKKLLLANILGAGIITPIVKYAGPKEQIRKLELTNTLKNWKQLLHKISGETDINKLSSLFGRNLTAFSKSAVVNFIKQLLMEWAIEIWENQDAYFPISQRLNKFFFYYHIHHWKVKNEVEELSWDLIKKFFIDLFFKEKGWFLLSQFGDFSSFVLKEWEKKEKPIKLYEWTLKYSNAGGNRQSSLDSESLYEKSTLESARGKSSYLFPEIQGNEEYSSFLSKLQHKGEVELSHFKKKLWTISEMAKLTDGYKLGALIHLYLNKSSMGVGVENNSESGLPISKLSDIKQNFEDISNNPLFLFLNKNQREEGKDDCLLIDNSLFNEKIVTTKPDCLYSAKWLSGKDEQKKTILASRELEGISFYFLSDGYDAKQKSNKTIDEQEPEVIEKVTQFLTENFESVFLKYLLSKKKGSEGDSLTDYIPFTLTPISPSKNKEIKKWDFSNFFQKHIEVINASLEYLESLYWAQILKNLQTSLLSIYKFAPKEIELEDNSEEQKNIKLPTQAGLFSPLAYGRKDTDVLNEELDFFELNNNYSGESSSEIENVFFTDLVNFLFQDDDKKEIFSLRAKATKLKELLLQKHGEKIFSSDSLEQLFLNDLFYRAQLDNLYEDTLRSTNTTFALKAEEILFPKSKSQEFREEENNFSDLFKKYLSNLQNKRGENENNWQDLINKSLFLAPFLSDPIEKKIFYGGQSSQEQVSTDSKDISEKSNIITKAKNHWLLDTFYLSDSAYDSASAEYKDFLAYLLSIKWLTENDYANMPKILNHILRKNKNKNAYLLWTKEITEQEKETLEGDSQPSKSPESDKKIKELLKEKFANDISNPLLRGLTTSESISNRAGSKSSTNKLIFSSESTIYNVDAYKDNGQKTTGEQKTKLSGFMGLITESFSTKELPQKLKDYIFKDFLSNNSLQNKNYSDEATASQPQTDSETGIIAGAFFSENQKRKLSSNKELLEILNRTNTKARLLKYLDDSINSLNIALENQEVDIESLTLKELKEQLSKSLEENKLTADSPSGTENSNIKELYKLFNRFSGYLYSSKRQEKSPYVISIEQDNSKRYYIGFLYQINQFDFEKDGIEELKKNLSADTINTLITLLSSNKEIREWIYESEIIRQLSL